MKRILILLSLILSLVAVSCSKEEPAKKPGQRMPAETAAVTVKTWSVAPRDLQLYAEVTGKLEGITDIVYYSEVAGKVKSIAKKLGDKVKKGEAIAYLDSENYRITYDQAASELKSAEANFEAIKIKTEATRKLFETDKVSKFEMTNDESALKKAEAAVDAARAGLERARINFENSKFLSPVDGSIAQINIKEGQFIAVGQPVAAIVDCSSLIIRSGVTEYDIQSIKTGSEAAVTHNGSDKTVYGKVTGTGKKPDATGSYPIEILIQNPGMDLIPGMIVRGKIKSAVIKDIVYTEFDNIVEEFGNYFVFLAKDGGTAEKRKVGIGKKYGNYIIINSGLSNGEKLIVSGVDTLTDGAKIKMYGEKVETE